jgi:Zn-finger nucleic acid-binding protein
VTITQVEQPYCPRCDSAIPQEHLERRPVEPASALEPPRHDMFAYCQHCDAVWRARRELSGGNYQTLEVVEVTDARTKRPFIRAVELKHGNSPLVA